MFYPRFFPCAVFLGLALSVQGCSLSRLSEVGETPALSPVQNPTERKEYQKVSLPMPAPREERRLANSLWRPGSRAFFKDLRANEIGDIVTVLISVADEARLSNQSSRSRSASENNSIGALAGLDDAVEKVLPGAPDLNNLLNTQGSSSASGSGNIVRGEEINIRVAAVVTQILPNGNLVIYGRQEMRVNAEMRLLHVAGIIRPQDISSQNLIQYDKIAEARVAYGGKGQISDVQMPRYGSQIADILLPF